MGAIDPLRGLRVVDFSTGLAGGYCTKLFVDLGADVVKVEPPGGDPLRRWTATGAEPGDADSAMFRFLAAGKRSVAGPPDAPQVAALLRDADVVVDSATPPVIDVGELRRHGPRVVVTITPYGLTGPWADRPANDFILQAESGAIACRGSVDRPPFQIGGRALDVLGGLYAAVAGLAALRLAERAGIGDHVDCSLLEVFNLTATSHMEIQHAVYGRKPISEPARVIEAPSIEPAADGLVGFNTNLRQHFDDFLVLIERPDLLGDDDWAMAASRLRRLDEWNDIVRAWTRRHTTEEIIERATALRLPVAPVNNGATAPTHPHFVARQAFRRGPEGEVQPAPPYRFDGVRPSPAGTAPGLGEHTGRVGGRPGNGPQAPWGDRPFVVDPARPLAGLRILDATAFWAGPALGQMFGALGADVIHLESTVRADGGRFTSAGLGKCPQWWELGFLHLSVNTDKRGLTLDLNHPEGKRLLCDLLPHCDALVENYSPRVFEHFGIDEKLVAEISPRTVLVRMPAFGLDGPWRDNVAFAQTQEQITGIAWATGYPDDLPRVARGPCDPLQGAHAAFALLAALRGQWSGLLEVSMVETALQAAAAHVVEYSAYGRILDRLGNRSRDAVPQGLYACRGHERWLALSIETDPQWANLVEVLGAPAWATRPVLATRRGREEHNETIDRELAGWAAHQELDEVVERLVAAGVPAGAARDPRLGSQHPQLQAREFIHEVDHPVAGPVPIAALPYRSANAGPWQHRPAPLLGADNGDILGGLLGLDEEAVKKLEAEGVIGTTPLGG